MNRELVRNVLFRFTLLVIVLFGLLYLIIKGCTSEKSDIPPLPPFPLVYEHSSIDEKMAIKVLEELDYKEYKLINVIPHGPFISLSYCKRKDWEQYEKERLQLERQFKETQEKEKEQEK